MKYSTKKEIIDGNTAAAWIAYAFSEISAIFPITPSSTMGELVDFWSENKRKNVLGNTVKVVEMQHEGGAVGTFHGALTGGNLASTFTSSQGLLLMIPSLYKIAGELLPGVFHVASRSLATHALSIFGDHSDVMATRQTGAAILASSSVQEAHDMALVAHLSALESSLPFIHFFEGFRISHEINTIELLDEASLKKIYINYAKKYLLKLRKRALIPENPYSKPGSQNADVYFQNREACNNYYNVLPKIVNKYLDLTNKILNKDYKIFEYFGHPKAENIIIIMGSGADTTKSVVENTVSDKNKIGLIKVRLYRPWDHNNFINTLPKTVKNIAVLDRTKEPGSQGEPLYQDVTGSLNLSNIFRKKNIKVIGGRYGLSSKEFSPEMVKSVFDHLKDKNNFHGFTVGINDDVTHKSINVKSKINLKDKDKGHKFWGFGSDGTVSMTKNTLKIIGNKTSQNVQGFFEYDSHKSGGVTKSYIRFGKEEINKPYLPKDFEVILVNNSLFINQYDVLKNISNKGIFILNTTYSKNDIFEKLPFNLQKKIIDKKITFYIINAYKIAREADLPGKINIVMQVAYFETTKLFKSKEIKKIVSKSIENQFSKKGKDIINKNLKVLNNSFGSLEKVNIPKEPSLNNINNQNNDYSFNNNNSFLKNIAEPVYHLNGDKIPVSAFNPDGSMPTDTTKFEKRNIAEKIPVWIPEKCIQCGKCAFVCPHSSIRIKQIHPKYLKNKPKEFKTIKSNTKNKDDLQFRVQIYPKDCTGCTLCNNICPTGAIKMEDKTPENILIEEKNIEFFENLPENNIQGLPLTLKPEETIKGSQLKETYFEFSGACGGCQEANYIKILTQLFGDRMIIANATGCSSIYGGTFPFSPYTKDKNGFGPAWANSLFEDNAEFGLGIKLAEENNHRNLYKKITKFLKSKNLDSNIKNLFNQIIKARKNNDYKTLKKIYLKTNWQKLFKKDSLKQIVEYKDYLIPKSVWLIGGDGWAYDVDFSGLDHVLSRNENINILVLDTETYSNTGGQASKSTPIGAIAKFASSGMKSEKKNLGKMIIDYGHVYVASVSAGANQTQLLKAFNEAQSYNGPSLIIAYSPCINHGIDMSKSIKIQSMAVNSGYWPLYRYNPSLRKNGINPFIFDSPQKITVNFKDYLMMANRYRQLERKSPKEAKILFKEAEEKAKRRYNNFKEMV